MSDGVAAQSCYLTSIRTSLVAYPPRRTALLALRRDMLRSVSARHKVLPFESLSSAPVRPAGIPFGYRGFFEDGLKVRPCAGTSQCSQRFLWYSSLECGEGTWLTAPHARCRVYFLLRSPMPLPAVPPAALFSVRVSTHRK